MAGRFPFESRNGQPPNQLNSAQLRAAMGMSSMDAEVFLRQQQENFQRDYHLRQILLQEQIDQQNKLDTMLHEQQLRAIGEHLQEFPDLQQHYNRLLLNEQLQRHEERALQIRYQEEWRRQQQQLAEQQQLAAQQVVSSPTASAAAAAAAAAATTQAQQQAAAVAATAASSGVARLRDIAAESLAGNAVKKPPQEQRKRSASISTKGSAGGDSDVAVDPSPPPPPPPPPPKRQTVEQKTSAMDRKPKAKSRSEKPSSKKSSAAPKQISTPDSQASAKDSPSEKGRSTPVNVVEITVVEPPPPPSPEPPIIIRHGTVEDLLEAAVAEEQTDEAVNTLTSFKNVIWSDSEEEEEEEEEMEVEEEKMEVEEEKVEAVEVGDEVDSWSEEDTSYEALPKTPLGFTSVIPGLPEEPLYEEPVDDKEKNKSLLDESSETSMEVVEDDMKTGARDDDVPKVKKVSNVLDYPYPIDTWWPSSTGIRRERRTCGESSDEDDFKEDPQLISEVAPLRANANKIRCRLSSELKPGVIEKLPHCKIHRMLMKRKKNISAPELVHCWQVTEIYPNDIMVCCSVCGTWRHASCGGHWKPFSVRENIDEAIIPVCDFCRREEILLRDAPEGRQRLERQRMEQLRRGLATSAVMRQASFSKHGGTYKWPLGRVSATHIGGHTRSVHSRHDKAEKQWTDMASRLGRGYGYRPKERVRVRTKELERLLVSVEDAEAQTDRHNMLLFLMADTAKKYPVGFESLRRNIFDPAEDGIGEPEIGESMDYSDDDDDNNSDCSTGDMMETLATDDDAEDTKGSGIGGFDNKIKCKKAKRCAREGCRQKPRFDSLFCSDSCGVSALEADLLRSLQESSDIHPAVLRN